MINVSIIEDNKKTRDYLNLIICETEGYRSVGTYQTCESAIEKIERDTPDVILMDIGLPGMSGVEGTYKIKEILPDADIIMLTVSDDDDTIFAALRSGADGYLTKPVEFVKVLNAIEEVYKGGAPMSRGIARKVVKSFERLEEKKTDHAKLTKRETEVLRKLAQGRTYDMIANELYISIETVRSHTKNIYKKLHVNSKAEAVAEGFRKGIVN